MPLDPVIAGGFRGIEIQSPLEAYGRIAQLQQAQNQNALAQYQLGAAQRAEAKDIARTNALAQAGTDDTSVANALLKAGDVKGYSEFIKSRREMQKAETDLADAKLKQARGFLDTINPADPNAPAQYIAWHEANHRDPVLGPLLAARGITADQSRARIQQAIQQGPQAFAQLLMQSKLGTEEFIKQNKPITVAPGASVYRPGETTPMFTAPAAERPYEPTEVEKLTNALRAAPPGSVEAQALQNRLRILTTREPKEPREPSAPVAVFDEATGKVKYVSREEAVGKTPAAAMEGLSPKEIQKREAALPQATSAIKGFETKSDSFIRDLKALRDDPGLENITGPIFGRTGSVSAAGSRAQALYDKVVAKGGFQALQDLRDASKTGGALGNVSNQEGKQLTASFAAIDRRQNAADVRAAIDQAIADIEGSKTRMREAYDATYAYKQGGAPATAVPSTPTPAARTLTGEDRQALDWANANPKDPRAAQIKQRLGL